MGDVLGATECPKVGTVTVLERDLHLKIYSTIAAASREYGGVNVNRYSTAMLKKEFLYMT